MRIALDTNVLISGYLGGICQVVLDRAIEDHTVIISEYILSEFSRVLRRKLDVPNAIVVRLTTELRNNSCIDIVTPTDICPDACRDSNDLAVPGTAVAGRVSLLVTGDDHLRELGSYRGVKIITPRQFLEDGLF